MMRRARWLAVLVVLPAFLWACGDDEGTGTGLDGEGLPEEELTFLRFPPDLEPLVTRSGSFWAVKGQSRELVLRYQPEEPDEEGEEFLEFRVPGDALLRRPDGTRFERDDSVLITVTVADDGRFLFDFQPSGLQFDPDHAPRLRITYRVLEGDLDGDGLTDDDDDLLEAELEIWRQEQPGSPWFPVGSLKLEDVDEIDGEIHGFTGFGIAGRSRIR